MATKFIDIPLGPYLPDLGGAPNPGTPGYLTDAKGIRNTPHGYRGQPTLTEVSAASSTILPLTYYATGDSNVVAHFAFGDNTFRETRNPTSTNWETVTPAVIFAQSGTWDVCQFDDLVIVAGSSNSPFSKSLNDAVTVDFANLAGSPPNARTCARVRNHVVLGGLQASTDENYAVQTSAIGDPEDWPTAGTADARSKQSIKEYLPRPLGPVRKIVGGEKFGLIFQQRGITRMTYVGGDVVYEFDTFEKDVGWGVDSVRGYAEYDGKVYFGNREGLYVTDGYQVQSISAGKNAEATFLNLLSYDGITTFSPGTAVYDRRRNQVIFTSGSNNIFYDVEADRLTTGAGGYNLPQQVATSTSDPKATIYNIAADGSLQKLTDGGSTVAIQTGYIEPEPGFYCHIKGMHLLGASVPSLTLQYKTASDYTGDMLDQSGFSSFTSPNRGIVANARANAPLVAFRITGTMNESDLVRGIRLYYERGEPV